MITVNENRCPANHPCPAVNVCPVDAIIQKSYSEAPVIDQDQCIECGKCVNFCPMGAIG